MILEVNSFFEICLSTKIPEDPSDWLGQWDFQFILTHDQQVQSQDTTTDWSPETWSATGGMVVS